MSTTAETRPFQAEAQELLALVVHSLYRNREVFLRELLSNASDAIDKRRVEALQRPDLAPEGEPEIRIAIDRERRTLSVSDDGVGMTKDELVSNLGTIARSGTRAFLEKLRAAGEAAPTLIGQFGVGFYASFLVADEVVVDTLRAGTSEAWRWRSDGKGAYTVEPGEREKVGTTVTLHLRAKGEDEEDPADFLEEHAIRDVVERWSDFVEHPIRMEVEEPEKDGAKERRVITLNSQKPLWARPKDEIRREEYDEFYRRLAHDWTPPAEVIHFKAEGTTEYTALLFVPGHRPMDLFEGPQARSKIALYVRRVLILAESSDLLPGWLRFVRGLVDAPDLPLNVSREVLQQNPIVRQIERRLVKRVLETLATMLEKDREKYRAVWADFGVVLKEGIYAGGDEENRISRIALWHTTQADEPTTLGEYVARMKSGQTAIWYLAGNDRKTLASSPHLEAFQKSGDEVLFFVDPIDEWVVERLATFEGKPLRPIDRADPDREGSAAKEAREKLDREHRDALAAIEERLKDSVRAVRFSTRLSESPSVLVAEGSGVSANMERILRAARQDVPVEKRVLELNPDHALVKKLLALHAADPRAERVGDLVELLHGQALLAEGSALPDPGRFSKLLARLYA